MLRCGAVNVLLCRALVACPKIYFGILLFGAFRDAVNVLLRGAWAGQGPGSNPVAHERYLEVNEKIVNLNWAWVRAFPVKN